MTLVKGSVILIYWTCLVSSMAAWFSKRGGGAIFSIKIFAILTSDIWQDNINLGIMGVN